MASLRAAVHRSGAAPLFRSLSRQYDGQNHTNINHVRKGQGTKSTFISGPLNRRSNSTLAVALKKKHESSSSSMSASCLDFSPQLLLRRSTLLSSIHVCRYATIYRSNNRPQKPERPKAQTTIDEEEISKFAAQANLWWDETGEFEALHSMNALRVPLIRDALKGKAAATNCNPSMPLQGMKIIDIGSGGGILSEPLARLGATMIGIDASEENVRTAQAHLRQDPSILCRVKYIASTVEDVVGTEENKFDAVVASEVIEHVAEVGVFVESCCRLVKPGGSLFFTTINKTALSYLLGVVVAERVLRLLARGTHDWKKFISPEDLIFMTEEYGLNTKLLHGMKYNPFNKKWSWTSDTSINYALHFVKPEA